MKKVINCQRGRYEAPEAEVLIVQAESRFLQDSSTNQIGGGTIVDDGNYGDDDD